MDVIEAINKRQSIRAFKPDPVPTDVLRKILGTSLRAPSWANSQPWELVIVTGSKLEEIRKKFIERAEDAPNSDIPAPREYPDPYETRRREISVPQNKVKGLKKEDRERTGWWRIEGLKHFGAPAEIYLCIERAFYYQTAGINAWPVFDSGLVAENIMLLAVEYGLGTMAQWQAVIYPEVIREVLKIPDSKLIVLGIAIGYPDTSDPINSLRTDRISLDEATKWYGFK